MIDVSHVSRNFGDFRAVSDVSFSIPKGQIVGLLGPNGAGKTTTMRMITGFLAPTAGEIFIDGKNIADSPVEAKQKIGYMPESAPLYGDMIVEDYLRYVAEIQGQNPEVKVPLLCSECGLKEVMSKNINELSRGNRQRVALAHALMHDPEILILDEPTSGLDPNQVEDVRNIIREIGKKDCRVIVGIGPQHDIGDVSLALGIDVVLAPFQYRGCVVRNRDPDIPVYQGVVILPGREADGRNHQGQHKDHANCGYCFFHLVSSV